MIHKYRFPQLLFLILIITQLVSPSIGHAMPLAQGATPADKAATLLEKLTPEERVGQLFIVEFNGSSVGEESGIYQLLTEGHVGGVILKRSNDNFTNTATMLESTWTLTESLQQTAWDFSRQSTTNPNTNESYLPQFVPLFIGIEQEGNGYDTDQILSEVTPLPSQLAIGATWNPENAFDVGDVLGFELSKLGFNLYFGPSLDILETPRPASAGDLGTQSFGGNPYWVSLMAQSYIAGLHAGSENSMLVIGKHFPGYGGSDRPREESIPANLKSLEQLQASELPPYYAVMGSAPSNETMLDGVLLNHARYQAFQGTITTSTRPISFDKQAFDELFGLPQFSGWREDGGLVISDQIGTQAVRRWYDPTEAQFNARLAALTAFQSGSDLLYLGDFVSSDNPDRTATTLDTLAFFAQKYREDPIFAQLVDRALLRILTTKYELYDQFTLTNVVPTIDGIITIGDGGNVSFNVASQAVTLISPSPEDLNTSLPNPPVISDRIVIITDTYTISQCSECEEEYIIDPGAFREVVTRLYGPDGGGQIRAVNLSSFTFEDLENSLNFVQEEEPTQLFSSIDRADWIIFIMADVASGRPTSLALQRFLDERPDLLQDKNTIVFAADAPYFLDGTDISKLTAYYALYSKQPEFIEIAARLLFKEITAPGASPVSISGIEYNLAQALSPDPRQVLAIDVTLTGADQDGGDGDGDEPSDGTPEVTEEPPQVEFQTGDSITIETSTIFDFNKNPVPNGTVVRFSLQTTTTEGTTNQREITGTTVDGFVKVNTIIETAGILEIQAFTTGEPPLVSAILPFDVSSGDVDGEATPAQTATIPLEETPGGEGSGENELRADKTTLEDWLLVLLTTVFLSLVAYQSGANSGQVRWGMRWALTTLIGGMLVNFYLSFDLPGSKQLLQALEVWGVVLMTAVGAGIGWFGGWLWQRRNK